MAFNFGPIKKAYGWICDCFSNPPRAIRSTDNTCYGIGGDGENSMNGLACTEPPVSESFIVLAQDPPRCFGGVGPCSPMPAMFRAVFPCPVPGSTCDAPSVPPTTGTGTSSGTSTSTGTGSGHTCQNVLVEIPDNSTLTPATPYQDCAACWILSTSGTGTGTNHNIAGPFGGLTEDDCFQLNSGNLCYLPKDSSPGLLIWGTGCTTSNPDSNVVCDSYEWYTVEPIVVTENSGTGSMLAFPCATTYSGNFVFRSEPPIQFPVLPQGCRYVAHGPGQIYIVDNTDACTSNLDVPTFPAQDQEVFYGAGADCIWGFLENPGSIAPRYKSPGDLPPGSDHIGQYNIGTFNIDKTEIVFTRNHDNDLQLIGVWPETITLRKRASTNVWFGPEKLDTYRRKWQLEYNTFTQDFTLHSFKKIDTPKYTLHDTNPCVGNTKTLTLVPSTGTGTNGVGCSIAPETITLTRGADCSTLCPPYVEPGCSVILSRYCGEEGYGLGSPIPVSAIPGASSLCVPTRTNHHCCDVGCEYNGGSGDSCPPQKFDYVGRTDPWVNVASGIRAWDFSPSAGTLTGTFIEGNIVYTVDSNGLQCNSVSVLVQTSTTLPDSIAVKYPPRICLVPDTLMTCDVRQNPPTETGTGSIPSLFTGPCYNAGYKHDTGHQDFCDCFDTCDPVILGSITVGLCATANVCFARQNVIAPQAPDAKSIFTRLGCILVYDGQKFNALAQSIYCVGPGRWASDWYCHEGQVGDTLNRDFIPCSAVVGSFLGTTYATKNSCGTFPFFPFPTEPLVENKCKCVGACCGWSASGENDTPYTLNFSVVTSTTPCGEGGSLTVSGDYTSQPVTTDSGGIAWFEQTTGDPGGVRSGANIFVRCVSGQWTINCSTINTGDIGSVNVANAVDCPGLLLVGTLRFSSCTFTVTVTR